MCEPRVKYHSKLCYTYAIIHGLSTFGVSTLIKSPRHQLMTTNVNLYESFNAANKNLKTNLDMLIYNLSLYFTSAKGCWLWEHIFYELDSGTNQKPEGCLVNQSTHGISIT